MGMNRVHVMSAMKIAQDFPKIWELKHNRPLRLFNLYHRLIGVGGFWERNVEFSASSIFNNYTSAKASLKFLALVGEFRERNFWISG